MKYVLAIITCFVLEWVRLKLCEEMNLYRQFVRQVDRKEVARKKKDHLIALLVILSNKKITI